ncbi:ATP-grasp fold domain protein, DUF201-type [Thiorhodococcus drewsii AZ1]|uniref:ATP-grasp fold domain protein, DUF201-type n=1 Tax=Thiorhodococcus drewsii AZ1 TaxID=765913 RepID=G2DX10_9GAMM|nr:ATP-grasp domain-containing protein [Thiorhodococcus drewsii]EGV33364.1 ATP-grasp fold domain protein, DUF201-type [Thiorhodococcus drewsii AZ1]
MRIFVFEYITGGGLLDTALTPSLVREGDMMLRALVSDLTVLDGVECLITRDARLAPLSLPIESRSVHSPEQFTQVWGETLSDVDAVWPIVPEHQQALGRITGAILASGKRLLNSRPRAVMTATSKIQTLRVLESAGLPVVPTFACEDVLPDIRGRWVLKPDDGVGCLGIRLFQDRDLLCGAWDHLEEGCIYVAQPFVQGTPASLSLIARDGEARLLSVNRQRMALMDEELVLLGCVVNAWDARDSGLRALAARIAAAMPDLWGYVGVDLILTEDGPRILEVNPRLTTSYVGIKDALGLNPAAVVLGLDAGGWPEVDSAESGRAIEICLEDSDVA